MLVKFIGRILCYNLTGSRTLFFHVITTNELEITARAYENTEIYMKMNSVSHGTLDKIKITTKKKKQHAKIMNWPCFTTTIDKICAILCLRWR